MELKPISGGFIRPFGTAWFIIEFLKGSGPEDSKRIDSEIGAPMTDIHFEYKSALHRAQARDSVEKEEEKRIKKGLSAFSEEEYADRLQYYLSRIPYKLLKMRYSSFTRYFGHLKRLGWVEGTGKTEPSTIQDDYPPAPSRVFYRLTETGRKASTTEVSDPIMTLYH
ncbi:MAG: hypothetical protein FJ025_05270, partial [Chloroflexi bacterium]|nr:hypothetical protein [Chloroflexota bacterium]